MLLSVNGEGVALFVSFQFSSLALALAIEADKWSRWSLGTPCAAVSLGCAHHTALQLLDPSFLFAPCLHSFHICHSLEDLGDVWFIFFSFVLSLNFPFFFLLLNTELWTFIFYLTLTSPPSSPCPAVSLTVLSFLTLGPPVAFSKRQLCESFPPLLGHLCFLTVYQTIRSVCQEVILVLEGQDNHTW